MKILIKIPIVRKAKQLLALDLAFSIAIAMALMLSGCKKFVGVSPPTTEIVTASVFNNNSSATSAQLNIYNEMVNTGWSYLMSEYNGLLADELTNYGTTPFLVDFYSNGMNVNDLSSSTGPWQNAYNYIYQANAIISGLQSTSGTTTAVQQQLTGEALFIRAFWHFYLTNCYGDVPLAVTTDYTLTSKLSRSPRIQVLQQVITDLTQAYGLLNAKYVDATDTASTTERVRPNQAAAAALLARAYLYLGDYNNKNGADYNQSVKWSSLVINNPLYSLSPLNGVFLKNSTEAIWQLQGQSSQNNGATVDGYFYILMGAPNNSTSNAVSPQLLNAFEPSDNRAKQWISSYSSGGNTWYFPFKYKQNANTANGNVTEYTMVMRLGEQYLIRAEAEAEQNDLMDAIADLNKIRIRAGLPGTTATTQADLLTVILHERQVELFTEWGHRWFDLIRTGNVNLVMGNPGNVCHSKGGTWSTDGHQTVYPIPLTEIEADPKLTQNADY